MTHYKHHLDKHMGHNISLVSGSIKRLKMAIGNDMLSRVNVYVQLPRNLHAITVQSTNVRTTGIVFRSNDIVHTYYKRI